ncbi:MULTISPECIES: MurR/RpiR family transcriptional regulator [unclassified Enterococcus]|uniref:MurR/RpiR family transcriptional regulator n=1 Tax=unclassified Enterococcus TaxID=2608891 RepID=UPI00259B8CD1|nr:MULTISPECIES: MurR/RpiR family transcriptional regulator [unclassified Enterococcus]MDO0920692.1 MurR/RpiR family transcriptional regulator [Enterococcus sp. B1E2]WIV15059.1 MurR/RpiR family transcriptional regulator [Enterococcus sp. FZMF]
MDNKLSEAELFLWNYITQNLSEIPSLSIIKLSELANVSTTTIVRTMKKKGYEGYTSFKHHLKEQSNMTLNFSNVEMVDEEIRRSIIKNEQEVIRTLNMLDTGTIEDAIQKIYNAKRIVIFARGFSELIGEEMKTKFQLVDKYCELYTDPNIITTISKRLRKEDTVIFVSLNGETEELVIAAQNCYDKEIGSLLITASKESRLLELVELSLISFKSEISFFPDYEVRSRLPLSVIARILLDSYAIRIKKK